jgi:RNA polymerase sigma-70 factor (ECF subfamily)
LYYFHEQDVAAAARNLGLPEGTLKARLSRARALLRQRFPQLEGGKDAMEVAAMERGKEVTD